MKKCRHKWVYIGLRPHTVMMLRADIWWCAKCGAVKWQNPDEGAENEYRHPESRGK
jgi:hypothetical protein